MASDELFALDRPTFDQELVFQVVPRAGGGWPAFIEALARLLERCSQDGLWWATIDLGPDGSNPAFAHLGPDEGGRLWTEVSADAHLPVDAWLERHQVAQLRELGWEDPLDAEGMRNFHRSWPADQLADACAHVVATLVDVYGFGDDDEVRVIVAPFH
jgi:hypothetical protein